MGGPKTVPARAAVERRRNDRPRTSLNRLRCVLECMTWGVLSKVGNLRAAGREVSRELLVVLLRMPEMPDRMPDAHGVAGQRPRGSQRMRRKATVASSQ